MPLTADIKINGRLIETVWIGRLETLKGTDAEHAYATQLGEPRGVERIEDMTTFTHRYSDGARVCVQKALAALDIRTDEEDQ